MRAQPRALGLSLVTLLGAAAVIGCEPTLQQETGVVIHVEAPSLGRVDSFELLTSTGERLIFDTTELEFRPEFPAPHLAEHRIIGDDIVVTYKADGERLIATQLDDKTH
jgi:hypothetical protein